MKITNLFWITMSCLFLSGTVVAQQQPDRFYLPQSDQPFEERAKIRTNCHHCGLLQHHFAEPYPIRVGLTAVASLRRRHAPRQPPGVAIVPFEQVCRAGLTHFSPPSSRRLQLSAIRDGPIMRPYHMTPHQIR